MTLFDVIVSIVPALENVPQIHAMWLEGSWATGKNDENSDIDVWLDVDDETFEEAVRAFRNELAKVANIDWEQARGVYSKNPKLAKHTFHLEGFNRSQVIELDLQEHSRKFLFDKKLNPIHVIFDKDKTINWK